MKLLAPLICIMFISGTSKAVEPIKIATYNIFFLDDGINAERKANLQAVLEKLDADIIGFQEINDPAALENILGTDYQIAMIDDPQEVLELALAVRKPFRIVAQKYAFPDPSLDFAFPRSRNLLQVDVEGRGYQMTFLVHHAKSRSGGRFNNDERREDASKLITDYIRNELSGKNVILLGDFNDNPDDKSLNILEYGDENAPGGIDTTGDTFLFNATEQLIQKDICSYGYSFIYRDSTIAEMFNPVVAGSRAENNKWRGIEHDYFKDVKIKAVLLDQILVSLNLKDYVTGVSVLNTSTAVKGNRSRIRFTNSGLVYTERGSLASDHIPVWITLKLPQNQ